MRTEDEIGRDLRKGVITLEQAIAEFDGDDVLVYGPAPIDPATAMWDEVEDAGAGPAVLFAAMRKAGATDEQLTAVGTNIERLRAAGNTFP